MGLCICILYELLFLDGLMSGLGIVRLVLICLWEVDEVNFWWNLVVMYEMLMKYFFWIGFCYIIWVFIMKFLIIFGFWLFEEFCFGILYVCLCIIVCIRCNMLIFSIFFMYCWRSGGVYRLVMKWRWVKYVFEFYWGSL